LVLTIIAATMSLGIEVLVVRPIYTLQRAVRKMGRGHLTAKVAVLRGAELRELGLTINRMAESILAEKRNLETTIGDRTRALQEANARLEKTSVTDGLTGLFNHRYFHEVLEAELARSERHQRAFAVVMLDVDHFKSVNDSKGHPAGDELLRRIARLLSEVLRQTDVVARYGGEEFSAVLPETGKVEATQVAERIRFVIAEQLNLPEEFGRAVTASLGVSVYPEDGRTAKEVLAAADRALYEAKKQGRNQIVASRAA
jgi:two-component system, cell cycle response regulator